MTDLRHGATREVTLTLRLPPHLADQAEEVHAAEPEFLERIVLYGLTRRSIYHAIRERREGTEDLLPRTDGVQPIPEEEGRAILAENRQHPDKARP